MNREAEQKPATSWHAMEVDEAFDEVDAQKDGLSTDEAAGRLDEFGPNKLPEEEREGPLKRFLRQFHNVLIYVLLGAAVITALLQHWVDTGVIIAVVIVNALIGFIQEGKAEQALESIRQMLSLKANVIRDGERREISAEEVVPGDVVVIQSGDRVPADLRLIQVRNLQIEESALTGESEPATKSTDPLDEETVIGDRKNMAFSSTLVTYGQGRGVVVGTGADTEIGRIGEMISAVEKLTTPLLRHIERLGKYLSVFILGLGAVTFAFAYFLRDYGVEELFMIVVGLAVAAIPEGLPAIMTITLALGVQTMAHRNAIIRRLPAIETLGSVTVICSDKTGTLTRNEMTATRIVTPSHTYRVSGSGYVPEGTFELDGEEIDPDDHPIIERIARAGLLSSDSEVLQKDGDWTLRGEPTEGAVVTLALKAGLNQKETLEAHERLDLIPFESENQYMASLNEVEGTRMIFVKGAPERLLDYAEKQINGNDEEVPIDREFWEEHMKEVAAEGYRLLAVAEKRAEGEDLGPDDVESGLTMLGVLGLIDPPRQEAREAITDCRTAGIDVKMITGDHALTAEAIAGKLGLGENGKVVTGADLEKISDEDLVEVSASSHVFARTSPRHKLRLVQALQKRNNIVAMTGDGVNDAPALKRADVGIAMGIKGSQATKDVAEMVLTDDNFASIARAVREGRTIYDNLRKAILFILPTNGGEALILLSAVAVALEHLPITPVQILWVNMITAVTLALALAFEPAEEGVMKRPPRDPDEPILSRYLMIRIFYVSVLLALISMYLFYDALGKGLDVPTARTVAINTLVAGQAFYLINSRYFLLPSYTWTGITGNRKVLIAIGLLIVFQTAFTYLPIVQTWFGTAPVPVSLWPWITGGALALFVVVEIEKAVVRQFKSLHQR